MKFAKVHRILASLTERFSLDVFNGNDMKAVVEEALDKTGRWHQRECPLKAPFMLWFVIAMSLFRSKSIANILKSLMMVLRERDSELPLRPVTPEAICHARSRLGVEPLRKTFELLAERIPAAPSFHGFRVWGIDGVGFTVPDTEANDKAFGRPGASRGKAAFPQMRGVALVSTPTHMIRDCVFSRFRDSERKALGRLTRHLGRNDLLIIDRGLPSVLFLEKCLRNGPEIIARISGSWRPKILCKRGHGDSVVEVTAKTPASNRKRKKRGGNRRARRTIQLRLRLLEFQIGEGEKVRVLTSLMDASVFPALELALLYHERWECELSYDELKTHLITVKHGTLDTDFRSKTPEGVFQEAYGMLMAYNLIRGLMNVAAELRQISPLSISFVDTLHVIESTLPTFEAASPLRQSFLARRLLDDIAACLIDRPRRKRSCPRKVKVKMSNFGLKRSTDKGKRIDFQAELRMIA